MYYISKQTSEFEELCVTKILKGGLSLDNVRLHDDYTGQIACHKYWQVKKFTNLETAEKALAKLHNVGGFDDYQIRFKEGI